MKSFVKILWLTFCSTVLISFYGFSQQAIKLDDYFHIKIERGKEKFFCEAEVKKDNKSNAGQFLNKHQERFDFLLLHFPDCPSSFDIKSTEKSKAKRDFMDCLEMSTTFIEQFNNLLPEDQRTVHAAKKSFKLEDVLTVGSRFFHCDELSKVDTSVSMHICIGFNGLKELTEVAHPLELDAFLYEALFKDLTSNNPKFFNSFYERLPAFGKGGKKNFKDFDSYLPYIRSRMYEDVKSQPLFMKLIVDYYNENKQNLNFDIL